VALISLLIYYDSSQMPHFLTRVLNKAGWSGLAHTSGVLMEEYEKLME
jgi:hypothetical protein